MLWSTHVCMVERTREGEGGGCVCEGDGRGGGGLRHPEDTARSHGHCGPRQPLSPGYGTMSNASTTCRWSSLAGPASYHRLQIFIHPAPSLSSSSSSSPSCRLPLHVYVTSKVTASVNGWPLCPSLSCPPAVFSVMVVSRQLVHAVRTFPGSLLVCWLLNVPATG